MYVPPAIVLLARVCAPVSKQIAEEFDKSVDAIVIAALPSND